MSVSTATKIRKLVAIGGLFGCIYIISSASDFLHSQRHGYAQKAKKPVNTKTVASFSTSMSKQQHRKSSALRLRH